MVVGQQDGGVLATEVLVATPEIRNLIRTRSLEGIPAMIESSAARGMRTMDKALADLTERGVITRVMALSYAREPRKLQAGGS